MENENTDVQPTEQPQNESKLVAVLSYITFIGWIIAIILHSTGGQKTKLGAFHLRQSFGLFISGIVLNILSRAASGLTFLWGILGLAILVFVILGIINAAKGEFKPLPAIGEFFDKTFSFIQ